MPSFESALYYRHLSFVRYLAAAVQQELAQSTPDPSADAETMLREIEAQEEEVRREDTGRASGVEG